MTTRISTIVANSKPIDQSSPNLIAQIDCKTVDVNHQTADQDAAMYTTLQPRIISAIRPIAYLELNTSYFFQELPNI